MKEPILSIVIDCNVLISAGIKKDGLCRKVFKELIKHHQCFISQEIIEEYLKTVEKPHLEKYKKGLQDVVQGFLKVVSLVKSVSPLPSSFHLPDPDDEIYLATALSVQADAIVTGNKKHFPLSKYGEVKILNPREFLDQYTDLET